MKILLAPFYYQGYGIGHIVRMINLYNYFKLHTNYTVHFEVNEPIILKKVSSSQFTGSDDGFYDVVLLDSPFNFDLSFDSLLRQTVIKKYRSKTKHLIGFDVADYTNNHYDIIINLFNHNQENLNYFKGKLFSGVDYAILNDEILSARKKSAINVIPNILITFGGEDPNSNLLKTLKHIDVSCSKVTVVLGNIKKNEELNLPEFKDIINVIHYTNEMGSLLSLNDIIICGGGTTLIEALYIGNPVITVPQNKFEADFIAKIKSSVTLYNLNDLADLAIKTKDIKFRQEVKDKYNKFVDGRGKERILKIIQSLN